VAIISAAEGSGNLPPASLATGPFDLHIAPAIAPDRGPFAMMPVSQGAVDDGAHPGLHMESVRDLLAEHDVAAYPAELWAEDEASGVALAMLDADIAALAATYLENGGVLPAEQWRALLECAAVARVIVPGLTGAAWVYFARLYALSQAMLRAAPDVP
jgi:hypothetical protein